MVATRDRWPELDRSLRMLREAWPAVPIVVVDNASTDGTAARTCRSHPGVSVLALPSNRGAAARNVGARWARTPFVAFCDDDSWWAPGALEEAAHLLRSNPALGLVAGRVLVGPDATLDPTSASMAAGPWELSWRRSPEGPRAVTGFLACAAVVRRSAFLAAGGFEPTFVIGGEEELVAADLATAGWALAYSPGAVAHHHPSSARDAAGRRSRLARNAALTAVLRWSAVGSVRRWSRLVAGAPVDPAGWRGLASACVALPWALAERRRAPAAIESAFRATGG